ncbi:MAG TPA: LysE family translocator [Rhizomicrobium sp.]|nr:LysE family translocator [Rhizomicrobium sp.]
MAEASFLPPAMIAALIPFTIVATVTPGPNNIMLAASGVNFGLKRSVPQMAGIQAGVAVIDVAVGLGLGLVFSRYPLVREILQIMGGLYTLWLAWKIASAGSLGGGELPHPMSFPASFAFQWVNPKLWTMAITTMALYVRSGHAVADTVLVTLISLVINIPAMLLWAGFGAGLRDLLQVPSRIRIFNLVMALLLVVSVLLIFRG